MTVKPISAKFAFDRETKNTVRYQEVGNSPIVGQIYIQKAAYEAMEAPQVIEITIKAVQ